MPKRITLYEEPIYLFATTLLAFAVAMIAASNFGVSTIVAPAYIFSLKLGTVSFGQAEYIIQAALFIVFCIIMKKIKPVYFFSFVTCLFYGFVLDLWRSIIPAFDPAETVPGSFSLPERVMFFTVGMVLTSLSVALFFKIYLYPQVYDFFVKTVSQHFGIKTPTFKICFDFGCLIVSGALTLLFFGSFKGIGVGTLIIASLNGLMIGFFDRLFDHVFVFKPIFPKVKEYFEP